MIFLQISQRHMKKRGSMDDSKDFGSDHQKIELLLTKTGKMGEHTRLRGKRGIQFGILFQFSIADKLLQYTSLKQHKLTSCHLVGQKSRWTQLFPLIRVSQGQNQGVGWSGFLSARICFYHQSGYWQNESAYMLGQVIGKIRFLVIGCRIEVPISLLTVRWGSALGFQSLSLFPCAMCYMIPSISQVAMAC